MPSQYQIILLVFCIIRLIELLVQAAVIKVKQKHNLTNINRKKFGKCNIGKSDSDKEE